MAHFLQKERQKDRKKRKDARKVRDTGVCVSSQKQKNKHGLKPALTEMPMCFDGREARPWHLCSIVYHFCGALCMCVSLTLSVVCLRHSHKTN